MLVERLLRIALLGSTWVMYLLLFLSVFSIAAMVERFFFFRRNGGDADALGDELVRRLRAGDYAGAKKATEQHKSVEAKVIGASLEWIDGGPDAFLDAVEGQLGKRKKDLERGMSYLGTLGSNSPFIGLFGTVIGVIEAFHQLGDGANKSAMGNVMSGIAEALVATGVGLFVAIPAVVAYNIVQKKIASVETNVASIAKQVTASMKAEEARRHSGRSEGNSAGHAMVPPARTSEAHIAEAE